MKRVGSVTGTTLRILLAMAFLYLIISAWYFALQNLTLIGSTSTSNADDFSLEQLATLSFDNSNTSSLLLSPQFWNTVLSTSGSTIDDIVPNTIYGFVQSSDDWRSFVESNIDNAPQWLTTRPVAHDASMLQNRSLRAMEAGNAVAAAQVMDNYTEYAAGCLWRG